MLYILILQLTPTGSYKVFDVSAYCPCKRCCGPNAQGITASGYKIKAGDRLVAADKRYRFGTTLIVPGYNKSQPVKVLDRGGAIKGDKIDLLFSTHQKALIWGRKKVKVFIWE